MALASVTLPCLLWWLAALGSGLMGGVFFAFSTFVMDGLGRRPPGEGGAAMQAINAAALRPPFMALFFGTAAACVAAGGAAALDLGRPGAGLALAGAALYLAGGFGVTAAANVPLNEALGAAEPGTGEGDARWAHYRRAWVRWNHVRTAACAAAAALLAAAAAS